MKTFEDLKNYAIKVIATEDDDEYNRKLDGLWQKAMSFISSKYPEIYELIDDSDGDEMMDCLDVSNTEEDFIKELISYYYIDPIDLLEFDREDLIDKYIKSKINADSKRN